MRFLADENIHAKLLPFSREAGHDIRFVAKGTADPKVAALAKAEGRIILTHDMDFANTDRHPLSSHSGVILIRINPLYLNKMKAALTNLFQSIPESELSNRLFFVFEDNFVDVTKDASAGN